jgi:uncharacterized protein YuzE
LIPSAAHTIEVDGNPKTDGVHYDLDTDAGTVTFTPGNIPALGEDVDGTCWYGVEAADAEAVYLLVRRHEFFTADGVADTVSLAVAPSRVYEVSINDMVTTDYERTGKVITFNATPADDDAIHVIYEDETCVKQVMRVKSNGVEDPHSTGFLDDSESAFTPIGGTDSVEDEDVGTGDGEEVTYALANACVLADTLVVEVADTPVTNFTLDAVSGVIEFDAAPTGAITATYDYYLAHQIGGIPAGAARHIFVRGYAPSDATVTRADASLEVWAV